MDDPIKSIFESVSDGSGALSTSSEFNNFIKKMQEHGIIKDSFELQFFEKVWEEEVIIKNKWNLGQENVTDAKLTFKTLQNNIVKEFGGLVKGAPDIRSNLDEMEDELHVLGELIKRWCYQDDIDYIQIKQLLAMISELEISFSRVKDQTERLVIHQKILMEASKLKTLLKDHFIKPSNSNKILPSNPYIFQRDYQSIIEGHMYRRKLRAPHPSYEITQKKSNHSNNGSENGMILKTDTDILGLSYSDGKNYHYIASIKQKNGRKDIDITKIEINKKSHKYHDIFNCYEAHRQLYFSKYFIDCFGIDYNTDINKTYFYYEYIQSNSMLNIFQYLSIMRKKQPSQQLSHNRQQGGQPVHSNHKDNNSSTNILSHFYIFHQGISFRMGNVIWKKIINPIKGTCNNTNNVPIEELLKQRTGRLLNAWADFVDELLSFSSSSSLFSSSSSSFQHKLSHGSDYDNTNRGASAASGGNNNNDNDIFQNDVNVGTNFEDENDANRIIKVYYESDIYSGGIYTHPGEIFDIIIQQPSSSSTNSFFNEQYQNQNQESMNWYYPTITYPLGLVSPITISNGHSIHPIPIYSSLGNNCVKIRCKAQSSGHCKLNFLTSLTASSSSSASSLSLQIPITVYSSDISPTLIALLRSCRSIKADGSPSLTFQKLCSHDYFSKPPDLDDVTNCFITPN